MSMRMLVDARHPEETRVAVVKGNRIEEFDFESAEHKQLKGNIYLARVTRVEPSLQAAFVDYGGNRHGFLAFSEIHPDYYQIPVADRQALIDEEERAQREADAEADNYARRRAERVQTASQRQERVASDPIEDNDCVTMAAASEMMAPQAGDLPGSEQPHEAPEAVTPEAALAVTGADETQIDLAQLQSSSATDPVPAQSEEPMPAPTEP